MTIKIKIINGLKFIGTFIIILSSILMVLFLGSDG